ncbi:MAG: hypothetical protein AAGA56_23160, partial [Myxococcota bacterium]
FFNPKAQAVGIRTYDILARRKLISPRVRFQPYLARPGDSYAKLARMAGHSSRLLELANRNRSPVPGKLIVVPVRGSVDRVEHLEVPPRLLPPRSSTGRRRAVASPE